MTLKIYGQDRIFAELDFLIKELIAGKNANILITGPSGYGKTTLAHYILYKLGLTNYEISGPNNLFYFSPEVRVHFFDEIHELKTPEFLYPHMDSGQYVIIFATNEMGDLKEPLRNRCTNFQLVPYSVEEIKSIVRDYLITPSLSPELINCIVDKTKLNPRVAKNIAKRLSYIFKYTGLPKSVTELDQLILNVMNIGKYGLDANDRIYLGFLEQVGGRASLDHIVAGTGLDRNLLMKIVEPELAKAGHITITSKGRTLVT